jgi:hypothetical protein
MKLSWVFKTNTMMNDVKFGIDMKTKLTINNIFDYVTPMLNHLLMNQTSDSLSLDWF